MEWISTTVHLSLLNLPLRVCATSATLRVAMRAGVCVRFPVANFELLCTVGCKCACQLDFSALSFFSSGVAPRTILSSLSSSQLLLLTFVDGGDGVEARQVTTGTPQN
jgi:hypothetical protein